MALLGSGCSDDGQTTPKDKGVADRGADLALDGSADSQADVGAELGVDLGRDGSGDALPVDGAIDTVLPMDTGGKLDVSGSGVYGTITSKVNPVFDGKGPIIVGLYTLPPPFPPVQATSVQADMSKIGNTAVYQFAVKPAAGDYLLYAFLDDNNNAAQPFVAADNGDLAMAQAILVTIPAGPTPFNKDIDLDVVVGGVADGGADGDVRGALEGNIKVSAKPTLDAKGNVYVTLHDTWPPTNTLTSTVVNAADLSSPFSSVKYFLGSLVPGQYYLQVFLDDNNNVNVFAPGSDKDDLVHAAPIQVRIEPGTTTLQDVTLDTVKP